MRDFVDALVSYWWVYLLAFAGAALAVWLIPSARAKVVEWLSKEVRMPRWAIALDVVWRGFLFFSAITVVVLWYQSATRDEEADRNARIQACSAVYAATYSAWDSRAKLLDEEAESRDRDGELVFAQLLESSVGTDEVDPSLLADLRAAAAEARQLTERAKTASAKADEMSRRRAGLGIYSAASVSRGNDFECPALPESLMVVPIYPDGFKP